MIPDNALLTDLQKLLPAQFDYVMHEFGIPKAYLAQQVSQSEKATQLIDYARQQNEGEAQLRDLVEQTKILHVVEKPTFTFRKYIYEILVILLILSVAPLGVGTWFFIHENIEREKRDSSLEEETSKLPVPQEENTTKPIKLDNTLESEPIKENTIVEVPKPDSQDWHFSVSVVTANKICEDLVDNEYSCVSHFDKLNYYVVNKSHLIGIYPDFKQVEASDLFFEPVSRFRFPKLDIKLLNNTQKTIFIDNIELININSQKDYNPFISLYASACTHAEVVLIQHNINIASNKTIPLMMYYSIIGHKSSLTYQQCDLTSLISKSEEGYISLSLRDELSKIGINMQLIDKIFYGYSDYHDHINYIASCVEYGFCDMKPEDTNSKYEKQEIKYCTEACIENQENKKTPPPSLKEIVSKLKEYGVNIEKLPIVKNGKVINGHRNPKIIGYLEYNIFDYENKVYKKIQSLFKDDISIVEDWGCGSGTEPSDRYNVKLRSEGNSYNLNVPVSHSLKKGETDRFTILVGVKFSSFHTFRIKVSTVDNQQLISKPIELYIPNMQSEGY